MGAIKGTGGRKIGHGRVGLHPDVDDFIDMLKIFNEYVRNMNTDLFFRGYSD